MLHHPVSVQFNDLGREQVKTIFQLLREAEGIALVLADDEEESYGKGDDVKEFGNRMFDEIGSLIFWGVKMGVTEPF